MSTEEQPAEVPVTRLDRFLAVASLTLIVLAVICFAAIIIGTVAGADFGSPIWSVVSGFMYFGLPGGVVLFFWLLISNMVRRSRLAKAARNQR